MSDRKQSAEQSLSPQFNPILRGDSGALKRALYKSMGHSDAQLRQPQIAVVNTWTNATPGHVNLNAVAERVVHGITAGGGNAMSFGTIAPCDGIAEGHLGMRYALPARDVIAASIEVMVRAHRFDGMVLLGSCDKIVPAQLMAAARLDIPAIFVNGGPMYPANYRGKHWDGNIVVEAIGWKRRGEIDEAEFRRIEDIAEPGPGSCTMYGTANTLCALAEALGMSLPGSAMIPAVSPQRLEVAQASGQRIVELVRQGITARQIMTSAAFHNAISLLLATGGSTNAVMHLQAIHREAGLGALPLAEFDRLSRVVPLLAALYPASAHDMIDFFEAGGVMAVEKELAPPAAGPSIDGRRPDQGRNLAAGTGHLPTGGHSPARPARRHGGRTGRRTRQPGPLGRRDQAGGDSPASAPASAARHRSSTRKTRRSSPFSATASNPARCSSCATKDRKAAPACPRCSAR